MCRGGEANETSRLDKNTREKRLALKKKRRRARHIHKRKRSRSNPEAQRNQREFGKGNNQKAGAEINPAHCPIA